RLNLARLESAIKVNAVTEQSVSDQRTLVATTEAAIQADDAAIHSDEAAKQADEAAVQADEAVIHVDEAAIRFAQTQLTYTTIYAPIDGRTGLRLVDVGNIVHITD